MVDLATQPVPETMQLTSPPNHLLTGDAYLESIRDGRQVYLYGERVSDVTKHPAFEQSARSTAHLYDALHDPATQDTMTTVDRYTGNRVHRFFTPAHSADDLLKARDAIELWAGSGLRSEERLRFARRRIKDHKRPLGDDSFDDIVATAVELNVIEEDDRKRTGGIAHRGKRRQVC